MRRILFIAGYNHPVYHRKLEFLADNEDLQILHVTVDAFDRPSGWYLSAGGHRSYEVRAFPARQLGHPGDPHRAVLQTVDFCMREFGPHLIHVESDIETLGTAQVVFTRDLFAPSSKLVLYSWQNILRPRKVYVRLLVKRLLAAADHVCCANQEAADVIRQQGFSGSTSITPLIGLDRRYFYPRCTDPPTAPVSLPVVGYVGRLVPEKGVDLLVQAIAQMQSTVILRVVGDGPEQAELQKLAASLGIGDRCEFVGNVPYDRVPELMRSMDVFVLPSRTTTHWKEQFGRVLIEAMGCRIPVVGAHSGAIPEVIGDSGFTFFEGNATALARLLDRIVGDTSLLTATAQRGYVRATTRHTLERIAAETYSVWQDLLV